MRNYAELEKKLGYVFSNQALLEAALTHKSYSHAHGGSNNERLEYLGDAVLELLITERQYFDGVDTEGMMTRKRQGIVSKQPLKLAIERMGVMEYLRFVGKEDNVGDKTVSSLYESLLAAVYLDGGLEAARAFLARHPLEMEREISANYKGDLQEFLQKQGKALPVYTSEKQGKDNAPTYICVAAAEGCRGEGVGKTKVAAEQLAAKQLLKKLKNHSNNKE
jgi:ribonuclease-3